MRLKNIIITLAFFISFFLVVPLCQAADFKSDYKAEYFIQEAGNKLSFRVKFTIDITNLRSDVYVKTITLSFPQDFAIRNLSASDNHGFISPQVATSGNNTDLRLEFSDPQVGRDSKNSFYVVFDQDNLIQQNGNIWEIILPTLDKATRNNYQVILHLPQLTNKKISISKPKPDLIEGAQIIWNNPAQKTIYITLGDRQYYYTQLEYHLKNTKLTPVYTDIALPPDTLYQKIYVKSLSPKPEYVYLDEDGNYLARYILKPRQNMDVLFEGNVEIFMTPREEVIGADRELFKDQKKYLLNPDKNWDLKNKQVDGKLLTASDIYSYVTNRLTYDYSRSSKNNIRLGAYQTLSNPTRAVCVEFTDLFIALAREKGIYSREIQGFAFSENRRFRPLSLASDVLHSWPEYYDTNRNMWIQVDPTWENTSGIDYFSSFDFNHITFAIHGKKSDYPLPAGMYKTEETKDIIVKAVDSKIDDNLLVSLDSVDVPAYVNDKDKYQIKFNLVNNSNIYLWSTPIKVYTKFIKVENEEQIIPAIAPFEKKEVTINFTANKVKRKTVTDIKVMVLDNEVLNKKITIFPYYYDLALKFSYAIIGLSLIYIFFKFIIKKR